MSEKEQNYTFLLSLEEATDEDICPDPEKRRRKSGVNIFGEIFRYLIMAVCAVVFISSLVSIVQTLKGYKEAEDFYDNMYEMLENIGTMQGADQLTPLERFDAVNGISGASMSENNELFSRMKSRITALKQINPDIYGWIVVPGTDNIDYPILQAADNDYYLSREYNHGYMAAGSIFADYRCDKDINGNYNTVIYGHNMQNGMMFSELIKFLEADFFNKNQYIYVYTDKGIYTYRIFAVYKTNYKYKYVETGFPNDEAFLEFAKEMQSNSLHRREGISFDSNSRMLTLSTCTNSIWSDRYCVQAIMVGAYNEP